MVPNDLSFELNQCLRNGVLSLQKGHALACTEPFRIPLAGNVSKGDKPFRLPLAGNMSKGDKGREGKRGRKTREKGAQGNKYKLSYTAARAGQWSLPGYLL